MASESPPCGWNPCRTCSDDEWLGYSSTVRAAATRYAELTLWSATGRRFSECETIVRPCGRWCESNGGSYGWFWSYGTWQPFILDGLWRNCWCGTGPGCQSCDPNCQIWLPGPVSEVTEVSISGSPVVTGSYRLDATDGAWWLVRQEVDGVNDCWPESQDMNRALGEEDTWSVTYTKGIPVPAVLNDAAGILQVEWARACTGGVCRLPSRVQNLTRQGISLSTVNIDTLLDRGLTGITEVDQVIASYNPFGLKGRPRISSWESQHRVRYPMG